MTRRAWRVGRQNYQSHSVTKQVTDAKTTHFASGRQPKLFSTQIEDLAGYLPYGGCSAARCPVPRSQSQPS